MKPSQFFNGRQLELVEAALRGDDARVQALARAGVRVNEAGREDMLPLTFAVLSRQPAAIQSLLRAGADPANKVNSDTRAPVSIALLDAKDRKSTTALVALLDGGMSPDLIVDEEESLLHQTLLFGDMATMKLLISRGADVNLQYGTANVTALQAALEMLSLKQAAELLRLGARFDLKDSLGWDAAASVQSRLDRAPPGTEVREQLEQIRQLLVERGVRFPYPLPR